MAVLYLLFTFALVSVVPKQQNVPCSVVKEIENHKDKAFVFKLENDELQILTVDAGNLPIFIRNIKGDMSKVNKRCIVGVTSKSPFYKDGVFTFRSSLLIKDPLTERESAIPITTQVAVQEKHWINGWNRELYLKLI